MEDLLNSIVSTVPWPLPVRLSLENLANVEARHLVATALSQLGLALLLVCIAFVLRRGRIVALLVALPLIVLRLPALDLLLVDAYPTSYRTSPTGFSAASITAGRMVFAASCVACHGNAGDGNGGLGDVADLRRRHVWTHPAGDLFWFVSHGIVDPDGIALMPAFEATLPEQARWSAIDYVYALNAGAVTHGLDGWPRRVVAPDVALECTRTAARGLVDLRGKAIRIILGTLRQPIAALSPVNGIDVVTVWMPGAETGRDSIPGIDCVANTGAEAYAILAGVSDGRVTSARFLIDPEGVLRSVWREDDGDGWADPQRLLEEVRTICTTPLSIEPGDQHEHRH